MGLADAAGSFVEPQLPAHRFPRLQILTLEEVFSGEKIAFPRWWSRDTFKKGPRQRQPNPEEAQNNLRKALPEPYC